MLLAEFVKAKHQGFGIVVPAKGGSFHCPDAMRRGVGNGEIYPYR